MWLQEKTAILTAKAGTGHMQLDRLCQVPRQQHKPRPGVGHKTLIFMSWFTGVQANPQDFHENISQLVMFCLPRSSGLSPDVHVNRTRPESPAKSYLDHWESPAGASTRSFKASGVQAIHQGDYGELPWNAGPQVKSHRPERIKSGCHIRAKDNMDVPSMRVVGCNTKLKPFCIPSGQTVPQRSTSSTASMFVWCLYL